jgi:methanogenic corrinoid protein MtbC1
VTEGLVLAPDRITDLLLGSAPRDARTETLAAVSAGARPRDIYLGTLAPALDEVGVRWQQGRATVAQEHLATAVVSSIMATLAPTLDEDPPIRRRVVLACADGELHQVGLRMVGDFLEGDGWDVLYLGAAMPGPALAAFVIETVPAVVGISVSLTTHLEQARATIAEIRKRPDAPFVIVGGAAFHGDGDIARGMGADAFVTDAGAASRLLRHRFGDS